MRALIFGSAALLAACGQPAQAPSAAAPAAAPATNTTAVASAPWFFCDGLDAPVVYLFADGPEDGRTRFIEYDKRTGASVRTLDLQVGEGEGAAGSLYTPLTSGGAEFGNVRQINPGMLEHPAVAYTLPYSSVQIENRNVSCRWMPRTRVAAFTGRRSFVINEDADGDLIYTTYDFAHAANARPIDLSDNGRSTAFSVEVRNGQENVTPNGADFTFLSHDGFTYHVRISNDQTGSLEVLRGGARVQNEPLIAFIQGQAEAD
jgi:hypothetical protein